MNRPQFWWATPSGFKDVPYVRPLSLGQDPVISMVAGQQVQSYQITLDNDADQLFRSLFMQGIQQGQTTGVQVQWRDAQSVYLTDGFVPTYLYCWGAGSTPPDGGSGRAKVWEPELYCPRGGILYIDFFSPGGGFVIPGYMELCGVKRYPAGGCK
jgi:hypothetical protein